MERVAVDMVDPSAELTDSGAVLEDRYLLVLLIGTIELQLGLEWHTVGETTLQALLDSVARRIDVVIEKLEYVIVSCVSDWEVLLEYTIETFVLAVLCGGIHLEEIPKRFELNLQQIRIRHIVADCGETDSFLLCFCGHVEIHCFYCEYS